MTYKRVGGGILIFCFLMFVGLYITSSNGYYETEERKKLVLTEEKIKQFEEDIKEGKQVDVTNYLTVNEKNYDNQISSATFTVSKKVGAIVDSCLSHFFKAMENAMKDASE